MRFAVQTATDDDLPACAALDHSSTTDYVWQAEASDAPDRVGCTFRPVRLPRPMTVQYSQRADLMLLAWSQRDYFVVARTETQVYGYLNMRLDRSHGLAWVRDLVIDRPWRRHRIGSTLLLHAREWAKNNDFRRMMIETQTKNYPAILFCQRHGFVFCGFNDRYYMNQDIALFFSQNIR